MIARLVGRLEALFFGRRAAVLAVLAVITLVMGGFASRLQMDAGFDKQLPSGHEYTDTFFKYRETLFGANRLMAVVHARKGDIWNVAFLRKLNDVTKAVLYLPGVDRRTVSSLTPMRAAASEIRICGIKRESRPRMRLEQQEYPVGEGP